MAIAGAPITVELSAATSEAQPKLVLADLPDATPPVNGLPILARLPDYGMRPPVRNPKTVSFETAVRRWFSQRVALAILLAGGVLMTAMAVAPFVGRSPKAEPAAPQPTWEPITDQSTRHSPAVPGFQTNVAVPTPTAGVGPTAPQAANDRPLPQLEPQPSLGKTVSPHPDRFSAPLNKNDGLTRLPPIEKPQTPNEHPEVRRPISVEQLFAASADRSVSSVPIAQGNAGGASVTADAARSAANTETAAPIDSRLAQFTDSAASDGNRGGFKAPLIDRRLSPPADQPPRSFDEQVASTADADGPGTAQLEGVIETPSLRANYDPTHSQRY